MNILVYVIAAAFFIAGGIMYVVGLGEITSTIMPARDLFIMFKVISPITIGLAVLIAVVWYVANFGKPKTAIVRTKRVD